MLFAAPIASSAPHFDLVQSCAFSCAFAVPTAANKATEQHNTNVLRIANPPDVDVCLWFALASAAS
jgi:hypothetical protein